MEVKINKPHLYGYRLGKKQYENISNLLSRNKTINKNSKKIKKLMNFLKMLNLCKIRNFDSKNNSNTNC